MMALEARRMGYRVAVLDPNEDSPAVPLANSWIASGLDELKGAEQLAKVADVVTIDTEHVPASILAHLERFRPVRPSSSVLRTIQDRKTQRRFLEYINAPQPRCAPVATLGALRREASRLGFPCVIKSRTAGYDGKGQAIARHEGQLESAWDEIGRVPAMLEEFVDFDCEISALLCRTTKGEIRFYTPAHNVHRRHVLHSTVAPAPICPTVEVKALEIAGGIADGLGHVGMMAVEMFIVGGSRLLVNEIAPRPHNSGHFTFGACVTSQFEQHVRAVLGLPLGDPSLSRPAAMINLFGDLWQEGEPDWTKVFSQPEARLHLYEKTEPRPGRKMGHVLVLDSDPQRALRVGETLLQQLEGRSSADANEPAQAPCPG